MNACDKTKPTSQPQKKCVGKFRENIMKHKIFGTAILLAGNMLKV